MTRFNAYSTCEALFQHLEGAPMQDYIEVEWKNTPKFWIYKAYHASNHVDVLGEISTNAIEASVCKVKIKRGKGPKKELLRPKVFSIFHQVQDFFEVL